MNIISMLFIVGLLFLVPLALYIDACRQGRNANGTFSKRAKKKSISFSLPRFIPIKYLGKVISFITL